MMDQFANKVQKLSHHERIKLYKKNEKFLK